MSTPSFVDTSSLAGINRASRTPVQDYPRGSAPNLPAVRRTPPQFDFSDSAMEQRRLAAQSLAQQRLDVAAEEAEFGSQYGYTPDNLEAAYGTVRSAYFAMLNTYASPRATSLTRYPNLASMALEANVDQADVAKLINLVEVDRAAERVLSSLNLVYNEENNADKRIVGNMQIEQMLKTMNPVMRAATWDLVAEKIAAAADSPDDVPNALVEGIKLGAGKALEVLFAVPIWANEQMQRAGRASSYGEFVEGRDYIGHEAIQNIFEYWDKVEAGNYNQEILAAGRQQVGSLPIDLALQVEQAKASGDPDPLITVLAMNSANPEAMALLEPVFYSTADSSELAEAARIVDNASLGNTGQTILSTALRDEFLGTEGRAAGAGALNVYTTIALDPTLIGAKVRAGYLATRFALEKIAPGATAAGIKGAFNMRPVRRYYDRLLKDIDRYDDLVQRDAAQAAVFREQMRRQYPETPDYVIDDWRERGIRSVDDLADDVVEQNALFSIQSGQVAGELISDDVARVTPLFNSILSDGQALSRQLMLPRMTLTRVLKTEFSRTASKVMPSRRGKAVISGAYDGTTDSAEFAAMMRDPAVAAQAGALERASMTGAPGKFGKRVDSFFKYFGSLGLGYVSIMDGRDAKLIYRYGRSFLSRHHAAYIADRWRGALPKERYDILVGLNRTAAAARGIDLTDPQMLGRVDELVTATSETSRFAAKSLPTGTAARSVDEQLAAFEQTAETLKHGTIREFETFEAGAKNRWGRPNSGVFYFTESDEIAKKFGPERSVGVLEPEQLGDDVYDLYSLDEYIALDDAGKAAMDADLRSYTLDLMGSRARRFVKWDPETGSWVPGTIDDLTVDRLYEYEFGRVLAPNARVIETKVYGRTLDLIPPGGPNNRMWSRAEEQRVQDWYDSKPEVEKQLLADRFGIPLGATPDFWKNATQRLRDWGDSWSHEGDQRLHAWMRDNGYGKARVIDSSESGGQSVLALPEFIAYGANDPAASLAKQLRSEVDEAVYTDPSDFNGISKALFDWQTAKYVALPNFREMEQLSRWYRMLDSKGFGWVANAPQRVTDYWSLATLYGLRFSMRSAVEDLWFYAVITGGNLGDLYKGRRASTAIREARGRTRAGAWASLFGKDAPKSGLGMFNKRLRKIGDAIDNSNSEAVRVFGKFIQSNLDQDDVARAYEAARKGDFEPMRVLAGVALANAKMNGLNKQEYEYVLDLMSGPVGLKFLDELAETGRSINSGGLPDMSLTVPGADTMGVTVETVPRTAQKMGPTGDWSAELPSENSNLGAMLGWERFLNGVITNDGPVGRIIVANLDDVERAVQLAADEIRRDPTKFGYAKRFAALGDVTVEEFARRKVQAVRAGFSDAQGNLNEKLWRRVVDEDGTVKAFDVVDGERVYRITQSTLKNVPAELRPKYVLGQEYGVIPTPTGLGAFADNTWGWMGEQYARISREPIYIANYLAHRKQLAGYQRQLTDAVGEKAARRIVSRLSEDRAYNFTIAYTDNPANRSLLAYKVRNVSRYYRATEDFYRRMMRAGKNYPQGLWKTALIYDVLDDTGFVYTDDEGNKYFMYPGSQELMTAVAWFAGARGEQTVKMDYPFILGGKINMLAPSTDPNQAIPTIAGPLAGFSWRLAQQAFPSLARLNKLVLGEYGAQPDPTLRGAFMESFMPAGMARTLAALDTDERESMYAAAMKDAIAVAVANGAIPANAGPQAMNDPEFADKMAGISAIAWSAVITRFAMSWIVPASPQRYVDNVSEYARLQGVVSLRNGFLDLVQKKADAGAENPVGEAFVDWNRLNPNLFPYTVSKTEADLRPGKSYAPLKTAEEVLKWHRDNKAGLIRQYPDTAYFLAPQAEGFNWDTWGLLMGEGLRVSKDDMTFLRDVYAAYGEFEHFATIADYQKDLSQLDARDPEQYRQIRELEDQRAADLELIRNENLWWKLKYDQTRDSMEKTGQAELAFVETKRMVDELYDSTPEEEWQGSSAQAIRNVILTYIDYQTEINSVTGQSDEEVLRRRSLRFELQKDLEFLAEENPNAKLFITTVLYRDPGLEILDYAGVGVR